MNKYDIVSTLKLVKDYFNFSDEKLASELSISRTTLNNWLNDKKEISDNNLDNLYDYVFDKGMMINEISSYMYIEECNTKTTKALFHGSKQGIIGEISYSKAKDFNDFGKGFYCGENYNQAATFIAPYDKSSVYTIYFDSNKLQSIELDVDQEWMLAIAYYRGTLDKYKSNKYIQKIINRIDKADYIIAPIADNKMFNIIDTFINGEITDEQCKHCLAATDLGKQYVFKTQKCLNNLKLLNRMYICSNERKSLLLEKNKQQLLGQEKVKTARIKYRGKGKYIDEILL